jgi:hypothetical protein
VQAERVEARHRVEEIFPVRPPRPDRPGDDLGLRLEAEPAAVLRVLRVREVGERLDRGAVLELDRQPRLGVGVGDELALAQVASVAAAPSAATW